MNTKLLVALVTILGGLVTASRLSQAEDEAKGQGSVRLKLMRMMKNNPKLLQLFKLYSLTRACEVSLPQKSTLGCKAKRFFQIRKQKEIWDLQISPYGFALLDMKPWKLISTTFIDPFTRFYFEGYIQTVLVSDISNIVYDSLVNNITSKEIGHMYNYAILSKFFQLAVKLGGEYTLRPSQYEAFINKKKEWINDDLWLQQRLAGVNPMTLRRVTIPCEVPAEQIGLDWEQLNETLNPTFDWEGAVQKALGTDDSLEEAIKKGLIYAVRYDMCDDLPRSPDLTDSDPKRTMWNTLSPIALFASAKNFLTKRNKLVPVAIQMDYTPDSAVYTPDDGDNWMMAKLNVQVTDLGYAQIVEHLAKVHFLMEPFCVILKRTMSPLHPLHQILQYHCRDLMIPNTIGAPKLIGEGQFMDQLFAFGGTGTERLLVDAHEISTWEVTDFRNEIKKRGLDDKTLVPYFPYRDDGEEILEVIENMVKDYVDLYYHDNEDVKNDKELGNYLDQLSIDGGLLFGRIGQIQGLPPKISTKEELYDIVSRIISQLSIQHATVNYPLADYALYTPNLPTKLYNDTSLKEGEFSPLRLPNRNTSAIQASFSNSLATYRFDTLFDYGNDLKDNRAVKLVNGYYSYLMNVVQPRMQEKNQKREERGDLTYPYLIPRWLPNGIQT